MATKSTIEWTEQTWNPTIGCSKQSPGCKDCYAMKMAWRLMHIPAMAADYAGIAKKTGSGINWTGKVTCLDKRLIEPIQIKKPTMFFVNSMSDLFHPAVPFDFVAKVFTVMALTPQHTYQILTKQPKRALEYFENYEFGLPDSRELEELIIPYWDYMHTTHGSQEYGLRADLKEIGWFYDTHYSEFGNDSCLTLDINTPLKNIWIGVSVENQEYADVRIPDLLSIPAAVRFLSCEPLLGPIDLTKWLPIQGLGGKRYCYKNTVEEKINWVIAGGESGTGKYISPMHPDWPGILRDQCNAAGVAFFFKQWGKYLPKCQSEGIDTDGYKVVKFQSPNNPDKMNEYFAMGKHNAGSILDGVEHKEMPDAK